MSDPVTLVETDGLRISVSRRGQAGRRTLVSFTGVGHGFRGMDIQKPEFFRAGDGYDDVIFVSDLNRTWGNGLDMHLLLRTIAPFTEGRVVDAIGNSMGGFLALLAPALFPVRTALAFAPQFSVNPSVVPWETRWARYTNAIETWRYPSLDGRFVDDTRYYVVLGDAPRDRRHAAMIPRKRNITRIDLPNFGHAPAMGLKDAGLLRELVARCLDQSYSHQWLAMNLDGFAAPERPALARRVSRKLRNIILPGTHRPAK